MYDGSPGGIALGSSHRVFELLGVNYITIGIPKAWSGFRSGISTSNMLILRTFKINSNDDTADNHGSRIQGNRKASIHQSAMCSCAPVEHVPHPEALMLQNIFYSLVKTASEIILSIRCETWFFYQRSYFNKLFLKLLGLGATADPEGSNSDSRNNNTLDCNIFWVYTHS